MPFKAILKANFSSSRGRRGVRDSGRPSKHKKKSPASLRGFSKLNSLYFRDEHTLFQTPSRLRRCAILLVGMPKLHLSNNIPAAASRTLSLSISFLANLFKCGITSLSTHVFNKSNGTRSFPANSSANELFEDIIDVTFINADKNHPRHYSDVIIKSNIILFLQLDWFF